MIDVELSYKEIKFTEKLGIQIKTRKFKFQTPVYNLKLSEIIWNVGIASEFKFEALSILQTLYYKNENAKISCNGQATAP